MRGIFWASIIIVAACRPSSSLDYLSPPTGSDSRVGLGGLGARMSQALQREYRGQLERTPPPVSLVPSDGSELALHALAATVTINGPIAHTELHFTFHNPEQRVREGRFAISLPPGAAVGRFAMVVGNEWREARIVSRMQGRQVYESFLHKRVDPALLEQDLGNQFSARVFPIPAGADKDIIIGYDHVVSPTQPYTLSLAGLPAIPKLSIAIDHDGARSTSERGGSAPADVVIAVAGGNDAVAQGEAFVARIDAVAAPEQFMPVDRVMILVDTSASRSTVMGRQADFVRRLVAAIPVQAMVSIAVFDHDVTELYRGLAQDAGRGVDRVLEHGALGASDLGRALDRAAASGMSRVVIVGDGSPTLGESDAGKLAARLAGSAIVRVDAVQVGQSLDRDTLRVLVRAGKQPGAIVDGRDVPRVVRQLTTALVPELPITVVGAMKVWPATTRGVAPGDPIWVTGLSPTGASSLTIQIGERRVTVTPRPGDATRIRRAVARAELVQLTEQSHAETDGAKRGAITHQIEQVALAHNLVSSQTSLLVLESDADEMRTLGARQPAVTTTRAGGGETIRIVDTAPTIDGSSTKQGITITEDYLRNIPVPGRTFEAVLGSAAGKQADSLGVSFSGSTSLENTYYVDGVNAAGWKPGTTGSALAQRHIARRMQSTAFPFGLPEIHERGVKGEIPSTASPYTGAMHDIMFALARNERDRGLELAARWQLANPGDVASIITLGEALEARGATVLAARAYGSLVDLYPNRAELLRAAGERLDRVSGARTLAIDAYRRALRERPDHASGYRLLAYSLVRDGRGDEALELLIEGQRHASWAVAQVLAHDARIIGAHLVARDPGRQASIRAKVGDLPTRPSMHVVLTWETDANDVDLHVRDRNDGHAFHGGRQLGSGGQLIADLTDGYGPEMFVVEDPKAFPYQISAHYFSRGPMGIGLGTVQVIRHDGAGNITVEDRPFLIQKDDATFELGSIR